MKVRLIKVFLLVMSFAAMISSFPAFAATPDPLPADTEPQAIIKQLMQGESAWVSLPDPVDIEEATSFRKTVQAYVDAVSAESETPVVRMTVWKKPGDNRAEISLNETSDDSVFAEEELEKMSGEAGRTSVSINEFVCKSLTYDKESAKDSTGLTLASSQLVAKKAFIAGKAVCQGYANLFTLLADQAGIETVKVRGYAGETFHVMNVVRTDEGLMALDSTINDTNGNPLALLISMERYCKLVNFTPIIDAETAFVLKYGV